MSKNSKRWYAMKAAGDGTADIRIFNDIGDFGITAEQFATDLDSIGDVKNLNIAISSNGGDVSQGFAIFNILARNPAWKTVTVEGLAASMASVIAMTGDTIIMPSNSMLMIHNPWGGMVGEADQMKSFGEALAIMQDQIADSYVARSGIDKDEVLAMMARETWLSAKKAVELGFADRVEEPLAIAAHFDLRKFNHVPKKFADANEQRKTIMSKTQQNANKGATEDESESEKQPVDVKAVRAQVLAHAREVRSLCNLAGFPKLADTYIDADLTLSEVVAKLDAEKAKSEGDSKGKGKGKDTELDNHNRGTGNNDKPAASIDPVGIYNRWNHRA